MRGVISCAWPCGVDVKPPAPASLRPTLTCAEHAPRRCKQAAFKHAPGGRQALWRCELPFSTSSFQAVESLWMGLHASLGTAVAGRCAGPLGCQTLPPAPRSKLMLPVACIPLCTHGFTDSLLAGHQAKEVSSQTNLAFH